jgi:hypothetical protein
LEPGAAIGSERDASKPGVYTQLLDLSADTQIAAHHRNSTNQGLRTLPIGSVYPARLLDNLPNLA